MNFTCNKKEPKIINKIEVIWLGGNELGYKDNQEFNYKQDVEAVKIVFDSNVRLSITYIFIPSSKKQNAIL